MKETHVVVSSSDSQSYFPANTPSNFISQLSSPILLEGKCLAGLKDVFIKCEGVSKGGFLIFDIFLAQASGTLLHGTESSLLKRVIHWMRGDKLVYCKVNNPEMTSLKPGQLSQISLYFKPVFPSSLSFASDTPTSVTLVLQQPCD